MTDRAEQTPVNLAQLREAIASGRAVVCYARCSQCQFGYHYAPPEWHSWAETEDVQYAAATGQCDPSGEKCACECAGPEGVVSEDRAEQAQPSGYTPPAVGAPTWPRAYGATISERGDRLVIEWPDGRGMSWVAPKVIEGWVEQVNELRGALERSRAEAGPLSHTLARSIRRAAEFRTERDALQAEVTRLRAVIAHAYADLMMDDSHSAMSGVDSATAALRAAGGQP